MLNSLSGIICMLESVGVLRYSWVRDLQHHHLITVLEPPLFGQGYQGQPPNWVQLFSFTEPPQLVPSITVLGWIKLSSPEVPYQ